MSNNCSSSISFENNGVKSEIFVKQLISYTDLRTAVRTAIDSIYNSNKGVYEPALKQYVINYIIVKYYTNYSGTYDIDEFMRITEYEGFLDEILQIINQKQISQLLKLIDEEIKYRNSRSEMDLFFKEARDVLKKWDNKLSRTFKPKIIEKVIKNLSETNISERDILNAVIDNINSKEKDQK